MMRIATVALALFLLPFGGCRGSSSDGSGSGPPRPEKAYAADASGLKDLWSDIVTAARRDERQKVHDLLASTMMTDDDLTALFGAARAKELGPRYAPMISRLVNIGAMELVAQILDRKYDDVEVFPIGAFGDPTASEADRATVAALPPGTAVYGVRVKRKTETRGLRYDFFVHRGGRWVTGNQLARYLIGEVGGAVAVPASGGPTAVDGAPLQPAPNAP